MTRVLIATDESDGSIAAAENAHALFGDSATYLVVNVSADPTRVWTGSGMEWGVAYPITMPLSVPTLAGPWAAQGEPSVMVADAAALAEDRAQERARQVADAAHLPDAEALGTVGSDVADAIVRAAHDAAADVIVVGSHDRSWFSRLFSPSVTDAVMREADIPVLVIS